MSAFSLHLTSLITPPTFLKLRNSKKPLIRAGMRVQGFLMAFCNNSMNPPTKSRSQFTVRRAAFIPRLFPTPNHWSTNFLIFWSSLFISSRRPPSSGTSPTFLGFPDKLSSWVLIPESTSVMDSVMKSFETDFTLSFTQVQASCILFQTRTKKLSFAGTEASWSTTTSTFSPSSGATWTTGFFSEELSIWVLLPESTSSGFSEEKVKNDLNPRKAPLKKRKTDFTFSFTQVQAPSILSITVTKMLSFAGTPSPSLSIADHTHTTLLTFTLFFLSDLRMATGGVEGVLWGIK